MVSQNIMPDPPINFEEHPNQSLAFDHMVVTKHYQHLLALAFAVKEINENHQILPNITLGFHIYDSYFKPRWTYQTTMELLSTQNRFIPNYQCGIQNKMGSVIGGLYSEISLCMATILGIYKVPQFTYGSVPVHNERAEPLSFYQMVPNESHVYAGFLRLLLHFRWTWVGVFAKDDDNGERHCHFLCVPTAATLVTSGKSRRGRLFAVTIASSVQKGRFQTNRDCSLMRVKRHRDRRESQEADAAEPVCLTQASCGDSYFQAGDLMIGGMTSQMLLPAFQSNFDGHPHHSITGEPLVVTKHYQHLLALAFAVKEINENHQILPNFTLGFHIYDSYFKPRWTYRATMELLSTQNQFTPNYQCGIQNKMRSVIGGLYSEISLYMATILGIYKLPQESYVERMVCPMDGGSLL
ncbi:vomeronasal type-2 receptor 1-like isoform X5 [Hemicordylus capensis]|uniref:vomeronasal type-2 receptor 1-like isoform X5 n=1 Tax=Hemicordylus capensis TaxID=884348 RepID=UPI00230412C5|nr:vomeronasal type-2 receptor 1-like isoform X5 [Hemicordylus capensis]